MSYSRVSYALRSSQNAANKQSYLNGIRRFASPLVDQARAHSFLRRYADASPSLRVSAAENLDVMPSLSTRLNPYLAFNCTAFESQRYFSTTTDQPKSTEGDDTGNFEGALDEGERNLPKETTDGSKVPLNKFFVRDLKKASNAGDGETAQKMVFDLYRSEIERTKEESSQGKMGMHPHLRKSSFDLLIQAWENSNSPIAHEKAEWVLGKMWEGHRLGVLPYAKPDNFNYHTVMNCWKKHKIRTKKRDKNPADSEKMNWLLQDMRQSAMAGDADMRPRYGHYFHVLSAYGYDREPEKCQEIIEMQKDDFKHGITQDLPDRKSLGFIVLVWRMSRRPESPLKAQETLDHMVAEGESKNKNMAPGVDVCMNVVHCWLESNHVNKEETALGLLLDARKRHLGGENTGMPDVETFVSVMNALAERGDVKNVEMLLRLALVDFENGTFGGIPGTPLFSSVIKAWSKSKLPDAPDQAETVLNEMWKRYDAGEWHCKPDRKTYTSLISCWANSRRQDSGERAEHLLRDMQKRRDQGNIDMVVNIYLYSALCNAWANSNRDNSATKVESIIAEMDDSGTSDAADSWTFNSWLKAIRYDHLPDKEKRAAKVLLAMKQRQIQPDEATSSHINSIRRFSTRDKR